MEQCLQVKVGWDFANTRPVFLLYSQYITQGTFCHHVKGDLLWETAGFLSYFSNSSFHSPNFPCKLSKICSKWTWYMWYIIGFWLVCSNLWNYIVIAIDNYFIVINGAFSQIWSNSCLVHLHFDIKATECMAFCKHFQIKFYSCQLFFAVCFKHGFIVMVEKYCWIIRQTTCWMFPCSFLGRF